MTEWWQSLSMLEQVLLYIAVPATLILLLQTALLFISGAGGDAEGEAGDGPDLDLDGDGIPDTVEGDAAPEGEADGGDQDPASSGLHILTARGIVAFFTLFGWGGLWLSQIGLSPFWALFLAIQLGVVGMVGIALLLREAMRLQYDGTMNIQNAVGLSGTVYLTVPAGRASAGKVNVLVQEQLREFEAVTDSNSPIPTGAGIEVVGLADSETLLVAPLK